MVFIRNVTRLMRPAVLTRCISPIQSCPTGASQVASFPSWTPNRSLHSTPATFSASTTPSMSSASPLNMNDTMGFNNTTPEAREGESQFVPEVSSESLMSSLSEQIAKGSEAQLGDIEPIFKILADNRDFVNSFEGLKMLRAAGIVPTPAIYGSLFRSGRRTLRPREIRALFGEELAPREGHVPQEAANETHSVFYASMQEALEMMNNDGAYLPMSFYDDMALGLSSVQQGGLLINLAVTMEKRGLQPSTYYYNKMLYCLPRCGLADRADVLFSRMVLNNLADQSSYVYRLGSLVYLRRVSEAEKCFLDMNKLYGLNDVACNTMINGYLLERKMDKALEILDMMKNHETCKPNNVTANTFVTYFYFSNDLVTAPMLLEYFSGLGFPSETADHGNLFKLFARNDQRRAEKMLEVFFSPDSSIKIDVNIYNAILTALLDRNVPFTFRATIARHVPVLPVGIESDSLAALCLRGFTEVRQIVAHMEHNKITPNGVTYELLMRHLRARGDLDACIVMYKRLIASPFAVMNNHRNYYLAALISKGDSEDLRSLVKSMKERRHLIHDYNAESLNSMGFELSQARLSHRDARRPPRNTSFQRQPRDEMYA